MTTMTRLGIDAENIAKQLRTALVGALVRYDDLTKLVGRDVTGEARGAMNSARRLLLREGIRFDVVRGEGLKRMSDSEVAQSGAASIRSVRRKVNGEIKKLSAVSDFNSLTGAEKVQHNTAMSVLGVMSHFSKQEQVKTIEGCVTQSSQRLLAADATEAIYKTFSSKADGGGR